MTCPKCKQNNCPSLRDDQGYYTCSTPEETEKAREQGRLMQFARGAATATLEVV